MKTTILSFLALITFSITTAQKTITGTVSNEWGLALDEAHVSIKGSDTGTVTDKGTFTLTAKKKDVLEVSHLGYRTAYVAIKNTKKFTIELKMEQLDEVLVIAEARRHTRCHIISCISISWGVEIIEVPITKSLERHSAITQTKLYPNTSPTGVFNLKTSENYDTLEVLVFNLNGQLIQSNDYSKNSNHVFIDLSRFSSGMYLIKIVANGRLLDTIRAIKA